MKYFNPEKYKKELQDGQFITPKNVTAAILGFTLFPYSTRQGEIEVTIVLFFFLAILFFLPRYTKYLFHTKTHRVVVGVGVISTAAIGYVAFSQYGPLPKSLEFLLSLKLIDAMALTTTLITITTIVHSLNTCGHEVKSS